MAAYNWLGVEVRCPGCGHEVELRCQTHVASSYDGDDSGRFFDRLYRLGQRMAWWPTWHEDAADWHPLGGLGDDDEEDCLGDCPLCGVELCATVRFHDRTPVELLRVELAIDG